MVTIKKIINSIGIKLDLSKATETFNRLLALVSDGKNWPSNAKGIVQFQFRKCIGAQLLKILRKSVWSFCNLRQPHSVSCKNVFCKKVVLRSLKC